MSTGHASSADEHGGEHCQRHSYGNHHEQGNAQGTAAKVAPGTCSVSDDYRANSFNILNRSHMSHKRNIKHKLRCACAVTRRNVRKFFSFYSAKRTR